MPFQFKSRPPTRVVTAVPPSNAESTAAATSAALQKIDGNSWALTEDADVITIRNLTEECHVVENAADGSTLVVEDVERCRLTFPFCAKAVHLRRVRDSTLVFLPTRTSILLNACERVELVLAAQQLRAHDSAHLVLRADASTAVIIEGCSDVRVAPYRLAADLLAVLTSKMGAEAARNFAEDAPKWNECAEPRDFDCVVGVSPNWSRLDASEWKTFSCFDVNKSCLNSIANKTS